MTDPKNCHSLLSSLSAYIDGELNETLCQAIETHMTECENCRIVVDTLEKTVSLYQNSAEPPHMPSDVRVRLFQRLNLEEFLD